MPIAKQRKPSNVTNGANAKKLPQRKNSSKKNNYQARKYV